MSFFAFGAPMPRPHRREWIVIALIAVIALVYLPIVVRKTVGHGFGDVQVFFRAGWAIWSGYPLYEVTDSHGWTYHYPPTFALLMGPFANPLPGYPQPIWAMPYTASVVVWYILNFLCMILSLHLFAGALERFASVQARPGSWQGWWTLRLVPFFMLLPYIGAGLERGQPSALLLLLIVAFLVLYIEKRIVPASFMLALAIAIKVFPILFALFPLLRRDWRMLFFTAGWCVILLIGLPMVCVGPTTTLELYRTLWTEHLAGIISGSMSTKIASEVSPGATGSLSIGSMLARIAAGEAFYSSPLPAWASAIQFLFGAAIVAAIAVFGHGGYWNLRGPQPPAGYPLLVAGAFLLGALPLMIAVAKPHYVTSVAPLLAVFIIEGWRRTGQQVVSRRLIVWAFIAVIAMATLELPLWKWIKLVGPMTWALLLLVPPGLSLIRSTSKAPAMARGSM
jgi:hypothetical protein